jgi:monothiol glutaredoxin
MPNPVAKVRAEDRMGLIDRIKRRLPLVGSPAPQPTRYHTVSSPPRREDAAPREEEAAPKSPRGDRAVPDFIAETVKANDIVLFMKGSPQSPLCGFSANAAGILSSYGAFAHVDVIADPEVREGVKAFTSWPTIPQIFVGGEFIGGADILQQMHASGDLKAMIEKLPARG